MHTPTESPEKVVDFAALVGATLLRHTAAAADVVRAILAITDHHHLHGITADVTYNQLVITRDDAVVRLVALPPRAFNFGAYTAAMRVLDDYLAGRITMAAARKRLHSMPITAPRYPVWVTRPLCGVAGLLVAVVFGAGTVAAAVAFAANVLIDWLFSLLGRRSWPSFFLQVLAGLLAAGSAAGAGLIEAKLAGAASGAASAAASSTLTVDGSQVAVAVIMMMLAGMTSTGAIQDLLTGWYLTGAGRLLEGLLNTVGLIVGIQIGVFALLGAHVHLTIGPDVAFAPHSTPAMLVMAALVAMSFTIVAQLEMKILPASAVLACATWWLSDVVTSGLSHRFDTAVGAGGPLFASPDHAAIIAGVIAAGLGAFLSGLISPTLGALLRVPGAALSSISVILLFPGLLIYRGLLAWPASSAEGASLLFNAFATALALAVGVLTGQHLGTAFLRLLTKAVPVPATFLPHIAA